MGQPPKLYRYGKNYLNNGPTSLAPTCNEQATR